MKQTFLILLYLLIFTPFSFGANATPGSERYWVGGAGDWSDSRHWSDKSGGIPGASVPNSANDVIFDSRSFTGQGDGVFIEGSVQCRSMMWKDVLYSPILSGSSPASISVYGSLVFSKDMLNQFKGKILFKSSSPGNFILSSNHFFLGDLVLNGGGEWKLSDDIRTIGNASILLLQGTLNTNNKNVHCHALTTSGDKARTLLLGSSHITVREKWNMAGTLNLTFDAGSSKIILPKAKSDTTFIGGNLKYGDVVIAMGNCNDTPPTSCAFFTITITSTPDSCNGPPFNGTATANITGGTGPFTYDWNFGAQTTQTATGLAPGSYLLQVTDGLSNVCSCVGDVTSPTLLGSNPLNSTPTSCNGACDGTASFPIGHPAGGTPPYSYSWSPTGQTTATATGLCGATTYTVIVRDSYGCSITRTKLISQPSPIVANGASTSLACFGVCTGSASVNPSGGTSPFTYAWSPGGATTSAIAGLCAQTYTCLITDANACTLTHTVSINQPPVLSLGASTTNLSCNSVCIGAASVTPAGGVLPYSYSWATGGQTTSSITGLCAGGYTATVTDGNGCTHDTALTITSPTSLTTTPGSSNITCFGACNGSVSANPSGGTAPYTYSWMPGGCTTDTCSGLCPNTYTATITDANGCTATTTVSVSQPALITATPTKTDVVCPGLCNGTASAGAAGGTAPYTYSWAPGGATTSAISNLCQGTYTVIVTDANGCDDTASITVNMPSPLLPNISNTNVSCFGVCDGSVSAAPTGGTPGYTYSWMPGGATTATVTGLCAGNYTLSLLDANGCPTSGTVAVTQPAAFTASVSSATPNPLNCNGDCNGTAVTSVFGGTPTYSYLWTNGATTASVTGLCAGVYSVTVTDANSCTAQATVTFLQPSTLSVTITSSDPTCSATCDGSISAIAGGGTPPYSFSWLPGGQTVSSIASLCAGTYTVTTTDSKGCTNTQTITLNAPSTLAANAAVVNNVSCSGACDGSASSTPTGGTAPFTYAWTGGQTASTATGLCAGTFSVTVTDANGCTDVDVITITQPTVLTSNISSTTSSCTLCNGTATVSTSGGTAPYTFLWTPGGQTTSAAVGLCVGNYTVDITDANGCANSVTVTINPVVTITLTVSGSSVSCPGACDGIATATPFGGGAPYTYSWSTAPVQTTQSASGLCAGTYSVTVGDVNGCLSTSTLTLTNPAPLSITMSSVSASCGVCNGTATAAPAGGTGGYSYTWSGFPVQTTATATGLCSGTYTVTVSDANNCTLTNTVTVGNIPAIADNPSTTLSACGGNTGAICLAPTGGTPAYTYAWAPGGETTACITGLTAGIYTVTISDAAGCVATFQNAVGNVGAPAIAVNSQVDPTCFTQCDGSISITASLGVPTYTYLWSPGGQTTTSVTGLCAGTYIIQVIDAQPCTSFASITLTDPAQFAVNPTITNVSCSGGNDGNICLSPSGGTSPYTYNWLPGGQTTSCLSGLTAGSYSVVVADASGCDDTVLIPVSAPASLSITIASTNVTCNGNNDGTATATVTGGTTLYTYAWSTGAPLPTVVGLSPATYSILVTDSKGCTATASVTITQPAVLTSTVSFTNITCNSLCDGTASLAASGGTTAYTYAWLPGGETTSSITGLCNGNYVVNLTDANGCTNSQSVAITQPAAISATVTTVNASCFGGCDGSASVSASGGTGGFTYSWNPGGQTTSSVTGLCTGSYTLNISDANGCFTTQLFSISAPAVLQANISNVSPTCFGACDGSATSAPVGGTVPYTYSWNTVPMQTTATATGLCSGSYTLTLSDANGCTVNQPVTIAAPPALTQANGVAGATCNLCNGSISLIASGGTAPYSFFWSTGATTATITGLCAGIYIDTVMDANGCISIDTIPVSNTTGPAITLALTNVTCFGFCNGTGTVTSATGDGPPWIYLWTFTGQTTQTATGLCPGQHFVTVEDTNGCKTIQPINITEPGPLQANPTTTNATCFGICNGSIVTSASGGTPPYTYLWAPGGQTTTSITGQCAGTYTLTLTDANSCLQTSTITIGQNTVITSTVTTTNATCNLTCNGTATVAVNGGTSPYTYAWSPTGQTTSTATGLCALTHTITVTDAIGCMRIDSAVISQPTLLTPGITALNPLCTSLCNGSITANPAGGTPPYTYLWSTGGTTSSATGLCAGNYTLVIMDANACASTSTVSLTDPAPVTATFVVTNASCSNTCDGSINLSPSGGTGVYTFQWSNSATTEDVSALCAGNYSVTITDANGCASTYTMNVGVITLVIANGGNDTSFCQGGTATLTSTSVNAVSIAWYQIASPVWTFIASTTTINQSPPVGVTGYALIATNGICSDTDTVNVTVNAYPVLVSTNDTSICQGDSVTICSAGAASYQWYTLPAWTPVSNGPCITVSPALGTTLYGVVGMNGVCSDTDSVAVTVLVPPVAMAGNDTSNCFGDSLVLCSSSLNATSVSWYSLPSWALIDTTVCVTVIPPAGLNDFALIASNGACSDTDTVSVTIYPSLGVDAGPNVTIAASASTQLNGTGNGTYVWTPASGLSNTTISNPTASPSATTTYTLTVTDTSGCVAWDTVRVTIINKVIPNDGISPNNDGVNDVWEIPNIEMFPGALVEVYNRWGELLFSTTDYLNNKWGGKYKGSYLPVGTYYYVIDLKSDLYKEPITGPITILR